MESKITSAEYQDLPIQLKNRYTRYSGSNEVYYELISATPLPDAQPFEAVDAVDKEVKSAEEILETLFPNGHGTHFDIGIVKSVAEKYHAQFATDAGGREAS